MNKATQPSRSKLRLLAPGLILILGLSLQLSSNCALKYAKDSAKKRKEEAAEKAKKEKAAKAVAAEKEKARPLLDAAAARIAKLTGTRQLHLLTLQGPVDAKARASVVAALAKVPADAGVVLQIDAVGGNGADALAVIKALEARRGKVVAYVRGSAQAEAALIPFAADVVVLAQNASWGALSPTQFSARRLSESERAGLVKEVVRLAGRHARDVNWARAMVQLPKAPSALPATPPAPAMEPVSPAAPKATPAMAPSLAPRPSGSLQLPVQFPPKSAKPVFSEPRPAPRPKAKPAKKAPLPELGRLVVLNARRARRLGLADYVARDIFALARRLKLPAVQILQAGKTLLIPKRKLSAVAGDEKKIDPLKIVAGTRRIIHVKIRGAIELALAGFLRRVIKPAKKGDLVIVDINTPGGRIDAALQIRDLLLKADAKTVAFINPRAISAGALISLACDVIAMTPGGSIGDAIPVDGSGKPLGEKLVSFMRKEIRATAEAKGRNGDLAEAMVDISYDVPNIDPEIKGNISGLGKGKVLVLTVNEAILLKMAELRVNNFDDLVSQLKLENVPVIRPAESWAEKLSRFLTNPMFAGLLMTIGMAGLLMELYSPGFGVTGIIGVVCLLILFFGHHVAGLSGLEPMLLFLLGVGLLGVEIFVTPGFGVVGALGIVTVISSLVWTLSGSGGLPVSIAWEAGYIKEALVRVFFAIIVVGVLLAVALRYVPRGAGPFRRLVLQAELDGTATMGAHQLPKGVDTVDDLLGLGGTAATALRPTGKARIGGRRLEVESEGGFVEKGVAVKVVKVEGSRIVVKETGAASDAPTPQSKDAGEPPEGPPADGESA